MGLPGLKCGKRFSGTATSAPLFGFRPGRPRLVLTVNAPMPRRRVQIGDANDAVRAALEAAVVSRIVNAIPPWATMNDDKRIVIVTSAYRKQTASQGNGARDLEPSGHTRLTDVCKHFPVDNIIEGLAS